MMWLSIAKHFVRAHAHASEQCSRGWTRSLQPPCLSATQQPFGRRDIARHKNTPIIIHAIPLPTTLYLPNNARPHHYVARHPRHRRR